jgi:uncharacterized coiled-coil DUF342 family protein
MVGLRRKSFERLLERIDASDQRAEERHRELIARGRAGERVFLAAFDDLHAEIERSIERADANAREVQESYREIRESMRDMRDSIRANTEAVLAMLDRMGPAPS